MSVSGKSGPTVIITICEPCTKWGNGQVTKKNLWNLNLLYSSSAFKEVIYPPGSMMNTSLHSIEPPGWQPELGFKRVWTVSLSLSPTAFLNQFHWLQRSFEEKRETFKMCVKPTTERAFSAVFLAHCLGKYSLVNVSQHLSTQQLSSFFNRRSQRTCETTGQCSPTSPISTFGTR